MMPRSARRLPKVIGWGVWAVVRHNRVSAAPSGGFVSAVHVPGLFPTPSSALSSMLLRNRSAPSRRARLRPQGRGAHTYGGVGVTSNAGRKPSSLVGPSNRPRLAGFAPPPRHDRLSSRIHAPRPAAFVICLCADGRSEAALPPAVWTLDETSPLPCQTWVPTASVPLSAWFPPGREARRMTLPPPQER
jgi:hypothetical protein